MHNNISRITYGRLVAECIGYMNNDSLYTYDIHANFGDGGSIDGNTKNVAMIQFKSSDNYLINIKSQYINGSYMENLIGIIKMINLNWV